MRPSRQTTAPLALAAALAAGGGTARADDVNSFLDAMEVDLGDVSNVTTAGDLTKMLQVRTDLGILTPQEGSTMGLMYTGNYGQLPQCTDSDNAPMNSAGGDTISVEFDAQVPSTANSFIFSFYFLSREYPIYVGSTYNDSFTVYLSSAAWNGNIVFDAAGNVIDVNNALFVVTDSASLSGTGFHCPMAGGGTGWVSTIAPVEPGETLHVKFEIGDISDGVFDSAVLVDDFYWSELDPKQPYTGDPLQVFFLSPKRGSVEGGETTIVYGANFTSGSRVYFDGVELDSTVLSDERISVVTPPGAPGFVDVTVKDFDGGGAVSQELTLLNGYTYYDTSSGEWPPEFRAIEPDYSHVDGGQTVTIQGDYFQPGALVYFDGVEATGVEVLNTQTINAVTPPHEAGVSEVVVFNPDGQVTEPPYPFTYSEDVPVPDGDDGDPADGGGGGSSTCGGCDVPSRAGTGALPLLAAVGLLAGLRRRTRG
ncbi:IPT/TIG domain-containing protein [Myxococcota bacterium]|nr:IPT/TIG domain-containing protein [Myxococcota bacterium]